MIYFYDGTQDGFLTAFVLSYRDEHAAFASRDEQLSLGEEAVFVQTDAPMAASCAKRLLSFDKHCLSDLNYLLRCGDAEKDAVALAYFRLLAKKKRPVRGMLSEQAALAAAEHIRRLGTELHRMRGFLRFTESASGALYAPCSPDNDIIDLLIPHFRARLPKFAFVIHDVKRKKAVLYDGKNVFSAPLERAEVLLSADELGWQALWRRYFDAVNIPERERLKQQRGYLPVRYRKYMGEFSPEKKP